jgi:hypothetical protein
MRVVYIAGPFTAPNAWEIEKNVRAVEEVGIKVAELGFSPLMPHTNTRFFHGTCSAEFWYVATEALLLKSDAVLFIKGWSHSLGCRMELAAAESAHIPRFFTLDELQAWKLQIFACGSACPDEVGLLCMSERGHADACRARDRSGHLRVWSPLSGISPTPRG